MARVRWQQAITLYLQNSTVRCIRTRRPDMATPGTLLYTTYAASTLCRLPVTDILRWTP